MTPTEALRYGREIVRRAQMALAITTERPEPEADRTDAEMEERLARQVWERDGVSSEKGP